MPSHQRSQLLAITKIKIVHLSLLLFLLLDLIAAQDLQCHVEGQCSGITVGFSTTDSYNVCLDRCKENANCKWITHHGDTKGCIEFYDCPLVDEDSCNNCFSGQVECEKEEPVCNVAGICDGHFVAYNHTQNVESCLEFCQSTAGCNWYSYQLDSYDCLLTEDCLILDDTCTNCLAGEKECQLGNSGGGIIGNKIFVAGGEGANYAVEVVDLLDGGRNKSCSRLADYPGRQYGPVGTFIDDFSMVCGGNGGSMNKCYNYDLDNDSWTETYSMVQERAYVAAVMVSPTKWWVAGGYDGGSLSSTEMFTVGEGFSPFVNLPIALQLPNLVKVNETHYMLLGDVNPASKKAWFFNMNTEAWESLLDLPVATLYAQAGLVTHSNGSAEVVVAAGRDTAATQIFSLNSQTWRLGPNFPSGKLEQGASVPYGNTFLIVGGYIYGTGFQDKIWKYGVDTGEWEELPQKLDVARDTTAAFLVPDDFITCDTLK